LIAFSLAATLSNFAAGQDEIQSIQLMDQKPVVAQGEPVSEMAKDLFHVFQSRDGCHWFASRSEGVFRYDGKSITRFSIKDGLPGDDVDGIQEDNDGNLYFNTDHGISKFDGRSFATLEPIAAGEWKNQPNDLWFGGGQDSGVVYRYDGQSLHRLEFPRTRAGDKHYVDFPRSKFPNAKFSPYDVYTIFKDSKGNIWFGTAVLGACRYDGKSFKWIPEERLQNGSFGTRSIVEDEVGRFWFTNLRHRYSIDADAAIGQGDASQWYMQEKGIGDIGGHKQGDYEVFISSTLGDDGALWMANLGGVVWRYDGKTMTKYPVVKNGERHWIFSIYNDRQGVLWLGTQAHGVYRFTGTSFEEFRP
jgi:ligand-binding sensor domain-containing protein